ncbi:pseudouridine synthase [Moritella sp. Urea-trap-13]|uniref:pseudouridine synthase n=1 Tax=Moritella sp. Urea-trap-13 TaxID=2058327 RepID=UPI000C34E8B4|nr:pseudouridine synthase [Moritella sp. Urea-trap-13]PKH05547.1 pseudouridine synthase [Moritella sp. Urea-trap-13]
MSTVRATHASHIVLPESVTDKPTVFSFLISHFQQIDAAIWQQRIIDGKVHWRDGRLITLDCAFVPRERVYYYREVAVEKKVPFAEKIIYQDDNIIVAYKPHFLAVSPSGQFVNECLVNRLRIKTGIETLVTAHRLDRATAGLMLLCKIPEQRSIYHDLFKHGNITKHYQAIARLTPQLKQLHDEDNLPLPHCWTVKNRIVKGNPTFTMQIAEGEANSHSTIALIAVKGEFGLFKLSPITGKTHQLRLHMDSLGMPLVNDRLYPTLLDRCDDNFEQPLQLLAQQLEFTDPVTGIEHNIVTEALEIDALIDGSVDII